MSAKSKRGASDGAGKAVAQQQAVEHEAAPEQANSFLVELMRSAASALGVDDDTLLSLAGEEVEAPAGKYDFAEDGDEEQAIPLPELREKHAGSEYKAPEGGTAFVQGADDDHAVDPNDAKQGALGDCYLIAGMIAVARANPESIADLIVDNGDGTFDVTLHIRESRYGKPKAVVTTIDGRIPAKASGSPLYAKTGDSAEGQTELWPALLEKAVAQQKGSYDLISGGNIATDFQFHGASELLTGKDEGYMSTSGMDEDDALLHMAIALEDNKPVTCDSKNMSEDEALTREATALNVYGNHAYCPEVVDLDARTIDLTNPWGSSHVSALPVADFMRYYRSIRVGA
ncbi:MAG: hypothetical protein ACI8PZ_004527 [Myxococcota bacterium]|jgi:hypothetical protein